MAISRRVTVTGDDTDGYVWTCGTCGNSASSTSASRDDCLTAFDTHYTTAPSTEVDQWLLATLTAGQAAATAAGGATAQAWTAALAGAPMDVVATWRGGGATHPQ